MLERIFYMACCMLFLNSAFTQTDFGNEWIKDYQKKYYKIKVGKDGLYRISYEDLKKIGLENVNADHFQIWNNGLEVPLYVTQSKTTLQVDGYLEFYGKMNDGKIDSKLYPFPNFQTTNKWSLFTDTAIYFLTTNSASPNLRYQERQNLSTLSTLTPEKHFNYTYRHAFKDQINPGSPNVIAGVNVYSSGFGEGEGWTSRGITPSKPLIVRISNPSVSENGTNPTMRIHVFGGSLSTRKIGLYINGNPVLRPFPLASYSSKDSAFQFSNDAFKDALQIEFKNEGISAQDQYMIGEFEISYPRKFDFAGSTVFEFSIDPSATDKLLEIESFNYEADPPILYDLTNQHRYVAEIKGGRLRFLIPSSSKNRNFVLLSVAQHALNTIDSFSESKFINHGFASHQGNFIIITDSLIRKSASGDAIENYKQYRSSATGGGFNVLVVEVAQLTDQFGYGIKKHPMALKNFIQYAATFFKPKNILLIGKGAVYDQYRLNESSSFSNTLNLVPTFGSPASDHLLASKDLTPVAQIPIGRVSVVNGDELNVYLQKLKQQEDLLNTEYAYQKVDKKGWTKNVLHLVAGGNVQDVVATYMSEAAKKISDTLYGAHVITIKKSTATTIEPDNNTPIDQLFETGLGIVNYFGHSSLQSMEFNVDDPSRFNNEAKYPLFIANACTAGNHFFFDSLRIVSKKKSISEAYILEPQKGSIAFIASTHYGIMMNLNDFVQTFYHRLSKTDYVKSLGEMMQNTMDGLFQNFGNSPYNLVTMEQILLHGDPAIRLYPHPKPDYVIENSMVTILPQLITHTDGFFNVNIMVRNIGLARKDSVPVSIKRDRSDGTSEVFITKIPSPFYGDSIQLKFTINPKIDRGQQIIHVKVDPENTIDEISKSNNEVIKKINILENEIRPVFPSAYAVVSTWPLKLSASIGNFTITNAAYIFQVDTTANFNSPLLDSTIVFSNGGLIEYTPIIPLKDSTVLYWRVSKRPTVGNSYNWYASSLVYISRSEEGWNQSHYFQYKQNQYLHLEFDPARALQFSKKQLKIYVHSKLKTNTTAYNSVAVGNTIVYNQSCDAAFGTIECSLISKKSGRPIKNTKPPAMSSYSSFVPTGCFMNTELYQFWFNYNSENGRNDAAKFLNDVPNETILVLNHWNKRDPSVLITAKQWNNDALYKKFISIGFSLIDSFNSNVPFCMVAYKNDNGNWELLQQKIGSNQDDELILELSIDALESYGEISFPVIGPSKDWKSISIDMKTKEFPSDDQAFLEIIGIDNNLRETPIYMGSLFKKPAALSIDTNLSFIDASKYPWIKINLSLHDALQHSPPQITYLLVKYLQRPEGALMGVDSTTLIPALDRGSNYHFFAQFKNISATAFDSIKLLWYITDDNNRDSILFDGHSKKLFPGDTIQLEKIINTNNLAANNIISLSVNPKNAQPEQFLFNNIFQTKFKIIPDTIPPLLNVRFDGRYIQNNDIISSRPTILMELTDENPFLPLNDTSLFHIRLRHPDGTIRHVKFDGDTLKFIPSTHLNGKSINRAVVSFRPIFKSDGEYELLVNAKDRSNNAAGKSDYRILFKIIQQSMISNLFNFPNPFTTSTAFVFTLTGSVLPSNMRIQIMTVTGRIVKEITMAELGSIKIGKNITEYKWDGKNKQGQLMATGLYLFRIIADIKGSSIQKLHIGLNRTNQFFKSAYGKMYMIR